MLLFGFALFEVLVFFSFLILMTVAVSFDRDYEGEVVKWLLLIGAVAGLTYFFKVPLLSIEVAKYVGYYLAAGLIYCFPELTLITGRSYAKRMSAGWETFLCGLKTGLQSILKTSQSKPEDLSSEQIVEVREALQRFIGRTNDKYHSMPGKLIQPVISENLKLEPKVNRAELAKHVGAWTVFWPFYFLSFVFGDLFKELCNMVALVLEKMSNRFMKVIFSGVFK